MLDAHNPGQKLFAEINKHLHEQGLMLTEGTIVDTSIIPAPKSTKNKAGKRDPEMHQTKKVNESHFGIKMHIGADPELGLLHSLTTTAANVQPPMGAGKVPE
jgi:IS5 family transposase